MIWKDDQIEKLILFYSHNSLFLIPDTCIWYQKSCNWYQKLVWYQFLVSMSWTLVRCPISFHFEDRRKITTRLTQNSISRCSVGLSLADGALFVIKDRPAVGHLVADTECCLTLEENSADANLAVRRRKTL